MEWLLVAVGLALALLVIDRAVARWAARGGAARRVRRPREVRAGGGSGALGDLIEVFQPNHHHLVTEQERQRTEVQEAGTGAPGFGVDLEAGQATVAAPGRLPARRRAERRDPFLGSTDMSVRSELFVATHADAIARADARSAGREPAAGAESLDLAGVDAIDLEGLGEIAARAVQYGTGDLELQEVDLDRESLVELPAFLREVLVELGRAEDLELPGDVATEWARDEDVALTPESALPLVRSIVALVTSAATTGRGVYLWAATAE